MSTSEITHFHLFSGSGGGALGFQAAHARVGQLEAQMRCLGGIDSDPGACRDFERFLGVRASCLDLFDEGQYRAFHGRSPPLGWREATPEDLLQASGGECPDIVFTSPPCKGFSGLLNNASAGAAKYQALNRLTVRGIQLMLEAFAARPPALVILENVPRIAQRGADLLADIRHELELAGYRVAETTHDCGELGGLAQHRRRFLLVARHAATIPPHLYEPPKHRVRGVGEVLGALPLPDDPRGGAMHRSPRLEWRTWVRLALIPAGGDWRSLQDLDFERLAIEPWHRGVLGVRSWEEPVGTVAARCSPTNGSFSIADPRQAGVLAGGQRHNDVFRVVEWDGPAGAVTSGMGPSSGGQALADPRAGTTWAGKGKYRVTAWGESAGTAIAESATGNGAFALADPRPPQSVVDLDGHVYGVTPWDGQAETVTGQAAAGAGCFSVADPRPGIPTFQNLCRVEGWEDPAHTIVGASRPAGGALSVADPRFDPRLGLGNKRVDGDYVSSGHWGVVDWSAPAVAVTGSACQDNGRWSVADPRVRLPADDDRCVPLIIALDGTWHRPFTTLELGVLQGYPSEEMMLAPLDGAADTRWRLHIGNSVPPPAAQAIGSTMAEVILRARAGQVWTLDNRPIWVRRLAIAASLA